MKLFNDMFEFFDMIQRVSDDWARKRETIDSGLLEIRELKNVIFSEENQ